MADTGDAIDKITNEGFLIVDTKACLRTSLRIFSSADLPVTVWVVFFSRGELSKIPSASPSSMSARITRPGAVQ